MDESLSWLRPPGTECAPRDLLYGLIRDIRLILAHPSLGNAARLAAITGTVDQLAPPPGQEADRARAAAPVAALLARNTGAATILLEELAGEQIRVELASCADRRLTDAECLSLHLVPGAHGHQRTGTLRTVDSAVVAAEVYSIVVPDRLPASARRSLGIPAAGEPVPAPGGLPLGKVLAGLAVRRESLGVRLTDDGDGTPGGGPSVESSARMWLADVPVALAGERVSGEFCQLVASRLAGARAGAA